MNLPIAVYASHRRLSSFFSKPAEMANSKLPPYNHQQCLHLSRNDVTGFFRFATNHINLWILTMFLLLFLNNHSTDYEMLILEREIQDYSLDNRCFGMSGVALVLRHRLVDLLVHVLLCLCVIQNNCLEQNGARFRAMVCGNVDDESDQSGL